MKHLVSIEFLRAGGAYGRSRKTCGVGKSNRLHRAHLLREGFSYPKGVDPNSYKEFKVGNTCYPDQIALSELANLMNHICKVGQGCRKEQLLKVTAQTLGITRLTTQLQTRLTLAIALGIGSGRLTKQGEYLLEQRSESA